MNKIIKELTKKGITESEIFSVIDKIGQRYKNVYTFGDYTEEDISQECFIFGIEGLAKFDPDKFPNKKIISALENFLAVHIRFQLLNLQRNKLCRTIKETNKFDKARKLIAKPINIDEVDDEQESNMSQNHNLLDKLSYAEIMTILDSELEVEYRFGFLKLLDGKSVSKFHRDRIITRVKEILIKYQHHS